MVCGARTGTVMQSPVLTSKSLASLCPVVEKRIAPLVPKNVSSCISCHWGVDGDDEFGGAEAAVFVVEGELVGD